MPSLTVRSPRLSTGRWFRYWRSAFSSGVVAYGVGLLVWPWEAISSTPLGRNHMLVATWTLAYWALMLAIRWTQGEAIWDGVSRWIMAGLAILGSILLGITGTLGGHLVGIYTEVSDALRFLGWEVYTTYYVPNLTLAVIVIAAIVLAAIGILGRRRFLCRNRQDYRRCRQSLQ